MRGLFSPSHAGKAGQPWVWRQSCTIPTLRELIPQASRFCLPLPLPLASSSPALTLPYHIHPTYYLTSSYLTQLSYTHNRKTDRQPDQTTHSSPSSSSLCCCHCFITRYPNTLPHPVCTAAASCKQPHSTLVSAAALHNTFDHFTSAY